ncbi:MAG TPA: dTMP kinase [Frankiaceae bacterium]|nr:dTMP kinase [Frankiaceae bacterium]
MTELAAAQLPAPEELRNVLAYTSFRRLWMALSLSSLGDWLGLLATTALANELAGGGPAGRKASFAIGGVLIFRLLPAVVLGPFAGAFADRFDRRKTMVVCDLLRFAVFASIPLVRNVPYLLLASFVVEAISLFWIPAKEASVPNLLPPAKLEAANQISLITTYGTAPLAAAVFAGLAVLSNALGAGVAFFKTNPVDLALYFDASTFLFSALTVYRLKEIKGARKNRPDEEVPARGVFGDIADGWKFVASSPLIRGLVVGILGAFAAGGTAIALGLQFVGVLGGGDAAYGMLFGAIFTGLAVGMAAGPRLLGNVTRTRLFGLAIIAAGASLSVMALLPNLILALFATVAVGACAGIAWIVGYTLLGLEVEDDKRGRTFATVQSLVRVDLLLVLALAPVTAGLIGDHQIGLFRVHIRSDGVTITLFLAGLIAVAVGVLSYRQMDDGEIPLWRELARSMPWAHQARLHGVLIAFEGGEGAGKSTQAALLAEWLRERRDDVVVTFEPGATKAGAAIRKVLLSPAHGELTPRAEAMLYAADRADHVETVIRPALARGAVVVTDRYVDSSLAYQGGGRALPMAEVRRLSQWATCGIRPDLTVLLDLDPRIGLERAGGKPDRMEAESLAFHERVRTAFRELAHHGRSRYVVIDASRSPEDIAADVRAQVERRLGSALDAPVPQREPVTT